jgi:hypothetical protein
MRFNFELNRSKLNFNSNYRKAGKRRTKSFRELLPKRGWKLR